MKLKRIVTMGMATLMAVSAMSLSAFAADKELDEVDFYKDMQVLTYNPETNNFDSSYEPISEVSTTSLPNYSFVFDQYVASTATYLRNLETKYGEDAYVYPIQDDDTMYITLNEKPQHRLNVELCLPNGTVNGPTGQISTLKTKLVLSGLYPYYNNIGGVKLKVKSLDANSRMKISGEITSK